MIINMNYDKDYGVACNEMNKDKYRLVINLNSMGDEIELP